MNDEREKKQMKQKKNKTKVEPSFFLLCAFSRRPEFERKNLFFFRCWWAGVDRA
jgi:hypothetical protein